MSVTMFQSPKSCFQIAIIISNNGPTHKKDMNMKQKQFSYLWGNKQQLFGMFSTE